MKAWILLFCLSPALWSQRGADRTPAGKDADGNSLVVVQQHFPKQEPDDKRCIPGEKFVLEKTRGGRAVSSEGLLTFCQSEDEADTSVTVAPNSITVSRNGGAHAGYYDTSSYQLSPWKAQEVEHCSFPGSMHSTLENWRFDKLRGQGWDGSTEEAGGICGKEEMFTYLMAPSLPYDADQLEKSHAGLGSCALELDASGKNGAVLWGKADPHDPLDIRLLLTGPHTLVAQVIDPGRFTRAATSWVNADHFEIWTGGRGELASLTPTWQFGIPVEEGAVQVGLGKPGKLPAVRRWSAKLPDGRSAVVLKIELPAREYADGFTVVYSQSLEGRAQKRMIGTSRVKRSDPNTMGVQPPGVKLSDYARCELHNGVLELTGSPRKPIEIPLPIGGLSKQ